VRHSHSVNFKIKAVFEAGSSQCTMKEVAARLGVHPTQLSHWKKQATDVLETHLAKFPENQREKQPHRERVPGNGKAGWEDGFRTRVL
jgi:transposase